MTFPFLIGLIGSSSRLRNLTENLLNSLTTTDSTRIWLILAIVVMLVSILMACAIVATSVLMFDLILDWLLDEKPVVTSTPADASATNSPQDPNPCQQP
jgi:hypothetical protein